MMPGGGRPATALEVAQYGHIATTIRMAMAAKGLKRPADLNEALGRDRGNANVFSWINGKGAPNPEMRAKLAAVLDVPESALERRKVDRPKAEPAPDHNALVRLPSPGRPPVERVPEVLQFAILADGRARLKFEATMPADRGVALLRILLDAGMLLAAKGEGNE